MKMNITCPKNSMNKMFCKLPVLKQLKNEKENKLMPETESLAVDANTYGMIILQCIEVIIYFY